MASCIAGLFVMEGFEVEEGGAVFAFFLVSQSDGFASFVELKDVFGTGDENFFREGGINVGYPLA